MSRWIREKKNEVNCRNGFRYTRRETVGFRICRIVFICRRRRSEDLLPFSSTHPPNIISLGVRRRCVSCDRTTSLTMRSRSVCTTLSPKTAPIWKAALWAYTACVSRLVVALATLQQRRRLDLRRLRRRLDLSARIQVALERECSFAWLLLPPTSAPMLFDQDPRFQFSSCFFSTVWLWLLLLLFEIVI